MTTPSFVTRTQRFSFSGVNLQIEAGTPCDTAITAASAIMGSVISLLCDIVDNGGDETGNAAYAVLILTKQVEAILESVEIPVRDAQATLSENQNSLVGGEEKRNDHQD